MTAKPIAAITGASSGIGAAFADRFAARGHDLLIIARRQDRLEALAETLTRAHAVKVETFVADLTDPVDLGALEARLEAQPVSVLVNNAGAGALGPTAKTGADAQDRLIRLNVIALARLSVAALAGFRKANAGTLINIASVLALGPSPSAATYSGSKAFVLNFTRSLQAEYAGSPIRIQAILPGPIRTEFFTSQGMSDDVFPASAFISAEALVDAALSGLAAGELVTVPTLEDGLWDELESVRTRFLGQVVSGKVADRYVPA